MKEFEAIIEKLNDVIYNNYPCPGCQLMAYMCGLCTLGLTCIIPMCQVKEAEKQCRKEIERINVQLRERKIKLRLVIEKSTSYIIMYLPNHSIWDSSN